MYPVFLRLDGRRVLVVGAGPVAARRVEGLLAAGARVTVVAPDAVAELRDRVEVSWQQRGFDPGDLVGVWLVQACAPTHVNAEVVRAAETAGVWCVDAAAAGASPAVATAGVP